MDLCHNLFSPEKYFNFYTQIVVFMDRVQSKTFVIVTSKQTRLFLLGAINIMSSQWVGNCVFISHIQLTGTLSFFMLKTDRTDTV